MEFEAKDPPTVEEMIRTLTTKRDALNDAIDALRNYLGWDKESRSTCN